MSVSSPHFALRPMRNAWSILRSVYGSHTVPCSDRHTRTFGKRPKRLCRIMPAVSSIAGRSPQYITHWNASKPPKVTSGSSLQSAPYFW